ncbi:MAG TPA: putative sulfate exporter family transporter [Pseudoduganella sp.]|jgi:uncharacterized integral membrane protein (TIGR00698 family)
MSGLAVRDRLPGVAVAVALALGVGWMAGGLGDPLARNPVVVAMLAGLFVGAVFGCPATLRPGLDFTKRTLLRLGVVLLGFRITFALLADLGLVPIAIAAVELVVVLLVVRLAARRLFRLDADLALLVAIGSAVCGAAAILSVASLSRARERQAGLAITLITLSGTVALLAYPVLYLAGAVPLLDDRGFGIAVGASIFELAQVYGASASVSEGALNAATLVKLSKVLMLVPLLLLLSARQQLAEPGARRVAVPWFIVGFVAVVALNSSITLHPQARVALLGTSQFLFMMTTVALGLTTSLEPLARSGGAWRLAATGVLAVGLSAAVACGLTVLLVSSPAVAGKQPGIDVQMVSGQRLFHQMGCAKCHVPALRGAHGPVTLYSDLLLHDMGPALDDKIVQGDATGADWRTTPLVGLATHDRYLHDGRALTLRDAVLAHGGEAQIVRDRFFRLSEAEQAQVFAFLSHLE